MIALQMKPIIIVVLCLVVGVVVGDIFETKKAPSFNKDNCEAKCLGLCLAGKRALISIDSM